MKTMVRQLAIIGLALMLLVTLCFEPVSNAMGGGESKPYNEERIHAEPDANPDADPSMDEDEIDSDSWILKWNDKGPDAQLLKSTDIVRTHDEMNVIVAKPNEGTDEKEWLEQAERSAHVEYVQKNQKVRISALPSDPYFNSQEYLREIRAGTAWDFYHDNTDVTIALVDTGVDLDHPDLKDNLVEGINLLNESRPPQDDNGHGTNVAGVVAAVGNNEKGTTGILWSARMMPIKALDRQGAGDEDKLGEGIKYAVDHGAKIVILSVGLYRYSHYLEEIVNYAEQKGVLLVAATGNDANVLGDKVAIKYPAAYPFVLAVGGSDGNKAEPRSNYGPEMDVVAPWRVYTTALDGAYTAQEGTSMAAPQVAAVAALIWAKYPDYEPYQIRNLIRQTAQDIGEKGWDPRTGYGLLRADRALTSTPKSDIYGDNGSRDKAAPFPIDTALYAALSGGNDTDWFRVDAPYDGTLQLQFGMLEGDEPVELTYFQGNKAEGRLLSDFSDQRKGTIPLKKGENYIQLRLKNRDAAHGVQYRLVSKFAVYEDAYGKNDTQQRAFKLPTRSQEVVGTFSREGHVSWFAFEVTKRGTLRLELETDSVRVDPAMTFRGPNTDTITVDAHGEDKGEGEYITLPNLAPGTYYISVYNAISAKPRPVAAEFKLSIEYITKFTDPNEPNDKSYQAVTMAFDTDYLGVFSSDDDVDWFKFQVDARSYVTLEVSRIPANRIVKMNVYDRRQKLINSYANKAGNSSLRASGTFGPGTYLVKLTADSMFDQQYYQLKAKAETLVSGYRDIEGHWAEKAISALTAKNWINGYEQLRFEPDRVITRAEAVAVLSKAFQLKESRPQRFTDVPKNHWAYDAIARATASGIVSGYSDMSFRPNRYVTRAEMTVMIGNALGIKPGSITAQPYTDVSRTYWAAPMLAAMKGRGLIRGYGDETFKPDSAASRAEFTSMLYDILIRK